MSSIPEWAALLVAALGGAGVTALVTVGTKVIDLRHRHDDARRDHYVALLDALDALHRATTPAAIAVGMAAVPEPADGWQGDGAVRARRASDDAADQAQAVEPVYSEARVAYQRVALFAPPDVTRAARAFYAALEQGYMKLFTDLLHPPEQPSDDWLPQWPEDELQAYQEAVRRDLGVATHSRGRWLRRR